MSYLYNSRYNRRRPTIAAAPGGGDPSVPTVADFQTLLHAYEALKTRFDEQGKELHNTKTELGIKNEALHKQAEEFRKTEAELVFAHAALADVQKQLDDLGGQSWQERFLRLQAEVDNLRKRWEQRYAAEAEETRRRILADMLPLADHLDLALHHAPQTDDAAVGSFLANIEATRRAFLETLRRYGVERLDPVNEPFDPNRHEAIGQVPSSDVPADHVAQVLQAGYAEGDRLIRPARVLVSGGEG